MIDTVHLSRDIIIKAETFYQPEWFYGEMPGGEPYVRHIRQGVWITYYPERERLIFRGNPIRLLYRGSILNVDDVYGADTERFITEVNAYLNGLFRKPILDIRTFSVKRIDYCFNIKMSGVADYVHFLNKAFEHCNTGRRVNHVQVCGLSGSVYVKTYSDYEHNVLRNYALNFYDKADCLRNQKAEGKRVFSGDVACAEGILRLEVQCGFQFIKTLCKRHRLERTFSALFSYDVALDAERMIYSRVFLCDEHQDFYTYEAAKALLPKRSEAAKKALLLSATHHRITGDKYAHGRKVIKNAGVYPFCFLKREDGVEHLENPIKLIVDKRKR